MLSATILAYLGPEAILPVLSVLAAIGGVFLMGWRWIASFFRRAWRLVFGRGSARSGEESVAEGPGETADPTLPRTPVEPHRGP